MTMRSDVTSAKDSGGDVGMLLKWVSAGLTDAQLHADPQAERLTEVSSAQAEA